MKHKSYKCYRERFVITFPSYIQQYIFSTEILLKVWSRTLGLMTEVMVLKSPVNYLYGVSSTERRSLNIRNPKIDKCDLYSALVHSFLYFKLVFLKVTFIRPSQNLNPLSLGGPLRGDRCIQIAETVSCPWPYFTSWLDCLRLILERQRFMALPVSLFLFAYFYTYLWMCLMNI